MTTSNDLVDVIVEIPKGILIPVIVLLSVVGAYFPARRACRRP